MRKPTLTEDVARGLIVVAGLADADMAADADRFLSDKNWKRGGQAIEYIFKLARWKLARVSEINNNRRKNYEDRCR